MVVGSAALWGRRNRSARAMLDACGAENPGTCTQGLGAGTERGVVVMMVAVVASVQV